VLDSGSGPAVVPAVLLSGHHADIERWRREQALATTARRRPDLIAAARAAGRLTPDDERFLSSL
jgi:tRNA (guanine37-N1)-methyltransferase